ncbi:MAG: hypothetical protein HRU20_31370, partial [Pseudomonadales bacterium]|nr:hypothetical protein [Pseudomonadales bacterium]
MSKPFSASFILPLNDACYAENPAVLRITPMKKVLLKHLIWLVDMKAFIPRQHYRVYSIIFCSMFLCISCIPDLNQDSTTEEDGGMKDERASQTATHQEEDQVIIIDPPDANDGVIEKVDCPGVRSVKDWESIFLNSWQSSHSGEYLARSTSPDSWKYYNLAYAMDANVAIWQATADVKYLNRALLYVQNVMALATQSPGNNFNDTYLGWAQHTHPTMGDNNNEYPLFESYMWRYVTRMLRLMKLAGMSESSSPYRTQYKSVLDFTEKHIWEKWKSRGMTHLYRSRTHMAAHWMAIGLDLMVTTED